MNWHFFAHGGKEYRVAKTQVMKQRAISWRARLEIKTGNDWVLYGLGQWDGDLITEMRRWKGESEGSQVNQHLIDAATAALHARKERAIAVDVVLRTQERKDLLDQLTASMRCSNRSDTVRRLIDQEAKKRGLLK